MSDLEEENRDCSDWVKAAERNEDQMGIFSDCAADLFCQAKQLYETIQIPGELNTRVRAAIESDRRRKKYSSLRLAGAGAAAVIGACFIMSQMGMLSNQRTEFTDPSRNVIAYPETREDVTVIQTASGEENLMETEEDTEGKGEASSECETEIESEASSECETEIESGASSECGTEINGEVSSASSR